MKKKGILAGILAVSTVVIGFTMFMIMAQASTVTVSATVGQTVSCNTPSSATSFGTLTTGSVGTSNPNVTTTISTNDPLGMTLLINDLGNAGNPGMWNSTGTGHLLASADATLAAGTEGYGVQAATSSDGGTGTIGISSKYLKTGNVVGGLTTSTVTLSSSTAPILNKVVTVTHQAAISSLTAAGNYSDTITYSCTGN